MGLFDFLLFTDIKQRRNNNSNESSSSGRGEFEEGYEQGYYDCCDDHESDCEYGYDNSYCDNDCDCVW